MKTSSDIMNRLDHLSGHGFVDVLAQLFQRQGYAVSRQPQSGDSGADLLLRRGSDTVAVQAKRWKGAVGRGAVQEVHTARTVFRTRRAVVVTNSDFTRYARETAYKCQVELWDREILRHHLAAAKLCVPGLDGRVPSTRAAAQRRSDGHPIAFAIALLTLAAAAVVVLESHGASAATLSPSRVTMAWAQPGLTWPILSEPRATVDINLPRRDSIPRERQETSDGQLSRR